MDPTVISDTIQEFNGRRYYLCGFYFQHKGQRLHRLVWTTTHGPIPDGWHVHHVNGNRADNRLSNLSLIHGGTHVGLHSTQPTDSQRAARANNARTHASAGNAKLTTEQRSQAAQEGWRHGCPATGTQCQQCGQEFTARFTTRAKFCSGACKQRALRARRRRERSGNG